MDDSERQALAREIAADRFDCSEDEIEVECYECGDQLKVDAVRMSVVRTAVQHGWDAAIAYIKERDDKTKLVESQGAG